MESLRAVFLLLAVGFMSCSRSSSEPSGLTCVAGPLVLPSILTNKCNSIAPSCPRVRPAGARTLVSMLACDTRQDDPPCAVQVDLCPLLPPEGVSHRFISGSNDTSACVSIIDVQLRPNGSGSLDVDWRALERRFTGVDFVCTAAESEITGHGTVGACCQGTFTIPLPLTQRRFTFSVQTDWEP
jgi:hypothetical protein